MPRVRFGDFEVDFEAGELLRRGRRIPLQEQPFQVLRMLLERRGEVVTREEFRAVLWPENMVADMDDALSTAVRKIRQALGESVEKPRFVETIPRRGYRFAMVPAREGGAWRGWLWGAGVAAIVLWVGASLAGVRLLAPQVLVYRQLTQDGRPKNLDNLLRGGDALFYQSHDAVWRLPVGGGAAEEVARGCFLLAVSPDGKTLLLAETQGTSTAEEGTSVRRMDVATRAARDLGLKAARADWNAGGNRIAYASGRTLWVMNAEDAPGHRVYEAAGPIDGVAWIGRTDQVQVFVNQGGKRRRIDIRVDGTELRRVEHGLEPGTNSPDGVFQVWRAEGSNGTLMIGDRWRWWPRRLTEGLLEFGFPVFSEDGSTLYSVGLQRQGELVRWDVRTRQMVPCLRGLSADGLSYSPDGRQLAYLTWPERALWKSAVDGSEPKRLTGAEHEVLMPRWTPQGDALVMIGRKGPQRPWKLYRMSAREGAVWEPLLPDRENVANPNYSPDGGTLLFGGAAWMTGFAKGTSRLWTWNGGTSQPREVPGSEDLWSGKWSPDGRKILAETLDSLELRLFDVAAGTWKTLYRGEQVIGYPVWSLDSRWVYFNGSATRERGAAVWRVEAATGRLETVLELGALSLAASLGSWFGMDPEGGLLFLRDASRTEVYAMELGFAWR